MPLKTFKQPLQKLLAGKGGYYYVEIDAATVAKLPQKKATRLVCTLNKHLQLHCGLSHLGNGNFFIIIAGRHVKTLKVKQGDIISFTLKPDDNPLGIDMPEVVEALLEQDERLKEKFNTFTDGKKRSLLFLVSRIKDIDKQVAAAIDFINRDGRLIRKK
mgnify:CR=1 FL=1